MWSCLKTAAHKEKFVTDQLNALRIEAYCPKYQRWVKHARRQNLVTRPLFPNYIFVNADDDQRGMIARTAGVNGFLGGVQHPSPVAPQLIVAMKQRENPAGFIDYKYEVLKSGDKVKIMQGSFTGFEAVFLETDERERVRLLIEFLGKKHCITLNSGMIENLKSP